MSSQNIPSASQVALDLLDSRLPQFMEQIVPALIAIEIQDGQKVIGQVTGTDTSFKLSWTCEFSRINPANKEILVEIAYGQYTLQAYSIIPVLIEDPENGTAVDGLRKRLAQSAMKNSMIPCLPLRDIIAISREFNTLIEDTAATFIVDSDNYWIY